MKLFIFVMRSNFGNEFGVWVLFVIINIVDF